MGPRATGAGTGQATVVTTHGAKNIYYAEPLVIVGFSCIISRVIIILVRLVNVVFRLRKNQYNLEFSLLGFLSLPF